MAAKYKNTKADDRIYKDYVRACERVAVLEFVKALLRTMEDYELDSLKVMDIVAIAEDELSKK